MKTAYIESYGLYVPAGRITGKTVSALYGKGLPGFKSVSVAELDEDSLTMGFEAAKKCLANVTKKIDVVILASTSLPYQYKKGSTLLAKMLKIEDAWCLDIGTSYLASAEAMWLASQLVAAGTIENVLVVTAEHPMPNPGEETDFGWGAGAAAFLVSNTGFAAMNFLNPDYKMEAYDMWKLRGEDKLRFRPEMLDDNFAVAIGQFAKANGGKEAFEKYRFVALALNRSRWIKALNKVGIKAEQLDAVNSSSNLGHLGTASLGINLALALDQSASGDKILTIGYAHGHMVGAEVSVDSASKGLNLASALQNGQEKSLSEYWLAVYDRRLRS